MTNVPSLIIIVAIAIKAVKKRSMWRRLFQREPSVGCKTACRNVTEGSFGAGDLKDAGLLRCAKRIDSGKAGVFARISRFIPVKGSGVIKKGGTADFALYQYLLIEGVFIT